MIAKDDTGDLPADEDIVVETDAARALKQRLTRIAQK